MKIVKVLLRVIFPNSLLKRIGTFTFVAVIAECIFVCVVFAGTKYTSDSVPRTWRDYEQLARKAYQKQDIPAFVKNLQSALALKPNHTRLMYNLSIGYALQARYDEALESLRKTAATGMVFNAAKNPAFIVLKDSIPYKSSFEAICKRFEESMRPQGSSTIAFECAEKALVTEGIAYDPNEKAFYVSSVHKRKILKIAANGTITDFSKPTDNLWSALGMKVDAKRRKLWVCTATFPQMQGFDSSFKGRAAVSVYDLTTGRIAHRYYAPNDGKPHTFGDLALHPKTGMALVSDSESPTIFVVDEKRGVVKEWRKTDAVTWSSLQGLDFSSDGKTLFVADYSNGIFRVDVQKKDVQKKDVQKKIVTHLPTTDTYIVSGTDGLYFYQGNLIGIQNGTNPHRIVKFRLDKSLSRIQGIDILEANNPNFDEPTLGVIAEGKFYYIANSQWGNISDDGKIAPIDSWKTHKVLKLKP